VVGGVTVVGIKVNMAVTVVLPVTVELQVPEPVQTVDQPSKVESELGVAVRDIAVPLVTEAVQVVPQERPLPEIVPLPVPPLDAVRV
jgi:hypothetical protein